MNQQVMTAVSYWLWKLQLNSLGEFVAFQA